MLLVFVHAPHHSTEWRSVRTPSQWVWSVAWLPPRVRSPQEWCVIWRACSASLAVTFPPMRPALTWRSATGVPAAEVRAGFGVLCVCVCVCACVCVCVCVLSGPSSAELGRKIMTCLLLGCKPIILKVMNKVACSTDLTQMLHPALCTNSTPF